MVLRLRKRTQRSIWRFTARQNTTLTSDPALQRRKRLPVISGKPQAVPGKCTAWISLVRIGRGAESSCEKSAGIQFDRAQSELMSLSSEEKTDLDQQAASRFTSALAMSASVRPTFPVAPGSPFQPASLHASRLRLPIWHQEFNLSEISSVQDFWSRMEVTAKTPFCIVCMHFDVQILTTFC
jgi:hypothetical protein